MILMLSLILLVNVVIRAEILPLWSSSLLDGISDETVPLKYLGPTPRLLSNCEETAQMFLFEYAYLSQNAFVTPMAPMRIPANLLHVDDPFVQSAVIRSESIALLINGTVFIYTLQTGEYQEVIIPADYRVASLEFSQYCCQHTWCEDWSDAVFAIGKRTVPDDGLINIFVIERGKPEPVGTPLPHDLQDHELLAAVPLLPWHSVALLLMTQNQEDHTQEAIFYYLHVPFEGRNPEREEDHTEQSMKAIVYSHHGDILNIVHLKNKFGEFLMWGPKELFISKTGGQSVFRASEYLMEHLEDDHGEYIQELIPGANGDFAFLTSEGRLFYGRSNLETHLVELHADDLVSPNSAISFDKQSNIFIMNAQHYDMDSHGASTDSLVYLTSELIYPSEVLEEQDHDLPSCPFLLFTADFGTELFYIDIGDSLTLRASYIPSLWQNSNIMIYASNPSIITANTSLTAADPIGSGLKKIEVVSTCSYSLAS
ncbi:uncharacterized protein LOC129279600 [Lytechinus pictus]|uniref:uncharacterized protein LOC129279600 n=1 Tax=Lytechinus pictus TaxID=7653 RepID=UPI0030B9C64F